MEEYPLQWTEKRVERKQRIGQVESLPDTWPQQDAPQYLGPIAEAIAQAQLIPLQRPTAGSILRGLEALELVLCPCVLKDPLRLAAAGRELHGTAQRVRAHQFELLREFERRGELRQDAVRIRLLRQSAPLLRGKPIPQYGYIGQ